MINIEARYHNFKRLIPECEISLTEGRKYACIRLYNPAMTDNLARFYKRSAKDIFGMHLSKVYLTGQIMEFTIQIEKSKYPLLDNKSVIIRTKRIFNLFNN